MRALMLLLTLTWTLPAFCQDDAPPSGMEDDFDLDDPLAEEEEKAERLTIGELAQRLAKKAGQKIVVEERIKGEEVLLYEWAKDGQWLDVLRASVRRRGQDDEFEVVERKGEIHVIFSPEMEIKGWNLPVKDVLATIAKRAQRRLDLQGEVSGMLTLDFRHRCWRALRAVSYAASLESTVTKDAIVVRPKKERGPPPPHYAPKLPPVSADEGPLLGLKARNEPIGKVVEKLAKELGDTKTLLVDFGVKRSVTLTLPKAPWRQTLDRFAKKLGGVGWSHRGVTEGKEILILVPKIFLRARAAPATKLVVQVAVGWGKSVVIAPEVRGLWRGEVEALAGEDLLSPLAKANGFQVIEADSDVLVVVGERNRQKTDSVSSASDETPKLSWDNLPQRVQSWSVISGGSFVQIDGAFLKIGDRLRLGSGERVRLSSIEGDALVFQAGDSPRRVSLR